MLPILDARPCPRMLLAAVLLAAGCARETAPPAPVPTARPHVVLWLVDTLRADHLGCYGYPRPVSPAVDAFAREAVLFEEASAPSSWTRASVASLFTGLWPPAHGANQRHQPLDARAATLAELFAGRGYRTAAFVSNPNLAAVFGFDQGFDHYADLRRRRDLDGVEVVDEVIAWLDRSLAARGEPEAGPYFLVVHTIDPHSPYDPPAELRRRFAPGVPESTVHRPNRLIRRARAGEIVIDEALLDELRALYDGEVAFSDRAFARLRDALETRGLWRDAVVAVLSDHGEEFFEHGSFEHGKKLFEESLRVPLIVRFGHRGPAGRVKTPVQLIDLFPTFHELLGVPPPEGVDGRSLLPLLAAELGGGPAPPAAPVLAYLHLDGRPWVSLRDGDLKLIVRRRGDRLVRARLYDLSRDPGERHDLAAERPELTAELVARLRDRLAASEARGLEPGTVEIDGELRERLEALGYL